METRRSLNFAASSVAFPSLAPPLVTGVHLEQPSILKEILVFLVGNFRALPIAIATLPAIVHSPNLPSTAITLLALTILFLGTPALNICERTTTVSEEVPANYFPPKTLLGL